MVSPEPFVDNEGSSIRAVQSRLQILSKDKEAIDSLLRAMARVDAITFQHCLRVGNMSRKIAKRMGSSEEYSEVVRYAGYLHDIGKIGIPHSVLHKRSPITDLEYEHIQTHVDIGAELLNPLVVKNELAKLIMPGVMFHHERIDGDGYPYGLDGNQIPLISKIVTASDAYDAMTNNRGYNKVKTPEEALISLDNCSGKQFDEKVAEITTDIVVNKTRFNKSA